MKSRTTKSFREAFEALSAEDQVRARLAYSAFEAGNLQALSFKKLSNKTSYSARISDSLRAVCFIENDTYVWYFIGTHSAYDSAMRKFYHHDF